MRVKAWRINWCEVSSAGGELLSPKASTSAKRAANRSPLGRTREEGMVAEMGERSVVDSSDVLYSLACGSLLTTEAYGSVLNGLSGD